MKNALKYIVSLLIAGGLLWYVFRDIDVASLLSKLQEVRYGWVVLAAMIFLLSYITRAYRWNLLLKPLGYQRLTLFHTVVAVAIGYFANLIVPRMGEVTRCGVLKRLNDVPVTTSLGTVVAERLIDLSSLLLATVILFVAEFDRLSGFLTGFASRRVDNAGANLFSVYLFAGVVVSVILLFFFFGRVWKEKLKRNALFQKVRAFTREVARGLTSVQHIENKVGFWVSTVLLWLCYFFLSYVVFFALPETENLTPWAGSSCAGDGQLWHGGPGTRRVWHLPRPGQRRPGALRHFRKRRRVVRHVGARLADLIVYRIRSHRFRVSSRCLPLGEPLLMNRLRHR